MNKNQISVSKVQRLTLLALMTALVVLLQFTLRISLGGFSCTMCLVPIVVGGALLGPLAGAWLGLVFGIVVLLSGDAAFFMGFNAAATIIIVILKGTAAGYVSAIVYKLISKKNSLVASIVAALACPVVNTGIFLVGTLLCFSNDLSSFATDGGYGSVLTYTLFFLIGGNFFLELGIDAVLSPVVYRLVDMGNKMFGNKLSKKLENN